MMKSKLVKIIKLATLIVLCCLLTLLAVRACDSLQGPSLEPWHTHVPKELSIKQLNKSDWTDYLAAEEKIFKTLRKEVTQRLPEEDKVPNNRYFEGSPVYTGHFAFDWNRSYIMEPEGEARGVVVLLHGLTDSPYSLRHIARRYRDLGYVAVAIRLPAHGTVPGALTEVRWEKWQAATRLAFREARRRVPAPLPLHVIGFSNGGALAMNYALDALDDGTLFMPDRIVLVSPMIGITEFARFAGVAGWPAVFPAFARAAWLSIVPEFNPFKYNSFPINGARQSSRLTKALQAQLQASARQDQLGRLPPILTFQSVMDFTVSTRAVVSRLYNLLPANGSELVLFDSNHAATFSPLFRSSTNQALTRLLPTPPRNFTSTVLTNSEPGSIEISVRTTPAGSTEESVSLLGITYPRDVHSLSHVALPFPMTDPLYGQHPDTSENYGINLGIAATRGEVNAMIVNLGPLMRMSSNPFFPYMLQRIEEGIPGAPVNSR